MKKAKKRRASKQPRGHNIIIPNFGTIKSHVDINNKPTWLVLSPDGFSEQISARQMRDAICVLLSPATGSYCPPEVRGRLDERCCCHICLIIIVMISLIRFTHTVHFSTRTPEDAMHDLIVEAFNKRGITIKKAFDVEKGLCLASKNGQDAINSISDPSKFGTIGGVPTDLRESSKYKLMESLQDRHEKIRTPFLCNAGFPGSGKSVLQAFNMFRFAEIKHGIAIEITFNDDQASLWPNQYGVTNEKELLIAVVIRMLHRIEEYMAGDFISDSIFREKNVIIEGLLQVRDPLEFALPIVRRLLGAPADTKIMLAVDELRKAGKGAYTPPEMMSTLCRYLDSDHSFYLSLSALGCLDIQKMVTGSNRRPLLQPLPPIFIGAHPNQIRCLPFVLRPFFEEEKRVLLPSVDDYREVYARVSELIHEAGGHPRRLQCLMDELILTNHKFEFIQSGFNESIAEKFAKELRSWLNEDMKEYIMGKVRSGCRFSDRITTRSSSELKSLAIDVAVPFMFPSTEVEASNHSTTLSGTTEGFCYFLESPAHKGHEEFGFAFIPPPVMDKLGQFATKTYKESEVTALTGLSKALSHYRERHITQKTIEESGQEKKIPQAGKALESAFLQSFLLYARCNEDVYPNKLCVKELCGEGLHVNLQGGPTVQCWDDVQEFPYTGETKSARSVSESLGMLISRLEKDEECRGAVFQPLLEGNMGGDVYGLFRAEGEYEFKYVLLSIQAKDYFWEKTENIDLVARWEKSKTVFPEDIIEVKDREGKTIKVRRINLLMTSNEVTVKTGLCKEFDGVITFQSMRNWLPTASFALEHAHGLRKIFAFPLPPSETNE